MSFSHFGAVVIPLLIDGSVKGAVLLLAAGMLASALRRSPASLRYWVWFLAIIALPAIPILSAVLPAWRALPNVSKSVPTRSGSIANAPFAPHPDSPPMNAPGLIEPMPAKESRRPDEFSRTTFDRPIHAIQRPLAVATPPDSPQPFARADNRDWILLAWLIGVGVVIGDALIGAVLLARLRSRTEPVKDAELVVLTKALCGRLNIGRNVMVLQSPGAMPMTWGAFRPAILLPTEAVNWPVQRKRAVVLHELGHIKRGDCLAGWLVRITCAAYWFHPLVWLATARLKAEREAACDDLVLRFGESAPAYAEHLLHVANAVTDPSFAVRTAVAMARRGRIDVRLRAILQEHISRRALSGRMAIGLMLALAAILLPLAMLKTALPAKAQNAAATQPVRTSDERFTLRAVDETGKPIANANLFLVQDSPSFPVCQPGLPNNGATAKTDDTGTAAVEYPAGLKTNIMAWATGYAPLFIRAASLTKDQPYELRFSSGQTIAGSVNQPDGAPIANAKIHAVRLKFPVDYMEEFACTGSTNAQGHFNLEHAAAGDYVVTAVVQQNGPPFAVTPIETTVGIDSAPQPLKMVSQPGAVFKGRLSKDYDMRVGNREVFVSVRLPHPSVQRVKTADDGSFTVYGIPASSKGELFFGEYSNYITETQWNQMPSSCSINLDHLNFDNVPPGVYDGIVVHFFKPAKVTGTVTDEQGKPFDKLEVIAHPWERVFFTDKEGRYSAVIPPMSDEKLEFNYGFDRQQFSIRLDEGKTAEKNVTFTRKVYPPHDNELTGQVFGNDGKPVAGARVELGNSGVLPQELVDHGTSTGQPKPTWTDPTFDPASVISDADGRFDFDCLHAGKTDVWASGDEAGFGWIRDVDTNTKQLRITLHATTFSPTFSGTVLDEKNRPVAVAKLFLTSSAHLAGKAATETTLSDANGHFHLSISLPDDGFRRFMQLACLSPDGRSAWKELPRCGGDDIALRLKPPASVTGRVLNTRGEPLANAKVWLYLARDPDFGSMFFQKGLSPAAPDATTAQDGSFTLNGLPAGDEVSLSAKHPDYQTGDVWYLQNVQPGTKVPDIKLDDGITMQGTVRYAPTNQPVAGASVTFGDIDDPIATTTADQHGVYQFTGMEYGWFRGKTRIDATVGTGPEFEGSTPYDEYLSPGDNIAGVDILIDRSQAARQADWLLRTGNSPLGQCRIAVLDGIDPKSNRLNAITLYNSTARQEAQYKGLNIHNEWDCEIAPSQADHCIYLYENETGWLSKFNSDAKLLWRQQKPKYIGAIATDPDTGNIWATETSGTIYGDGVAVFSPDGIQLHQWKINGSALVYSPHDKCFWISGQKLLKISMDGKVLVEAPIAFTWLARSLSVNPIDGSVWVAEQAHPELRQSQNRLFIVSSDGLVRQQIDLGEKGAGTIAIDAPRGVAWMMLGENLAKVSMDGKILATFPVSGDLCVEPDTGCPWVAGKAGIIRINPAGEPVSITRTTSVFNRACIIGP